MDKRRLLGTDLDVSVVCYGPMRAPTSADDPALDQHQTALRAALDHGVNLIHSSYEYGVRWMMKPVLQAHPARHDLLHVIKAPVPDWDDPDFDAAKLELRVDEALRDLCADRIALVQWMWRCRPHEEAPRLALLDRIADAVAEAFARLQAAGKVGHLACFPYFPQSAAAAMAHPAQRVLIVYYNPFEMEMASQIAACAAAGKGFLAIRPLYEGVFTSRHASQSELSEGHRLAAPKYAGAYALRQRLARENPEAGADMTRFAVRFPLMQESCASVIVGMNSAAQVEQICAAAQAVRPAPETVAQVRALSPDSEE